MVYLLPQVEVYIHFHYVDPLKQLIVEGYYSPTFGKFMSNTRDSQEF